MLDHLKMRIVETLAPARAATLATSGPASIQANVFPCQAAGEVMYVLVPRTSDHLLNIENDPCVVVATENWQLRGAAEILPAWPAELLTLSDRPDAQWCNVVRITPSRLHVAPADRLDVSETIDVD